MKSKFEYNLPMEARFIIKIKKDSPAHNKILDKKNPDIFYDITYAEDFLCNVETPIKAALGGEVIKIKTNVKKTYDKFETPKSDELKEDEHDGNFIIIKHEKNNDIEFSIYSHLNKVLVKKGDVIKAGDLIGLSGDKGWSIKPHLHFMVFIFGNPFPSEQSLEIRWSKN